MSISLTAALRRRLILAAACAIAARFAAAQVLPSMECGRVQTNTHIRCTALGAPALVRDHRAYWSDVPSKETLAARYIDESECHAGLEARCDQISNLPSSYSTIWTFDQTLGSKGCEEGATGNGWIDPYLAWRTRMMLPRQAADRTWLLTIVASALTAATIRAYPDAAGGIAACHLLITGVGTSKDIPIARGSALNEQRHMLSGFAPGEYLAELQCPAIQGSDCRPGKASVSLQITASPEER
jgi:hypothetical protein